MSDERIIGKIQEFMRQADRRFDRIEAQLEPLKAFRWKSLGAIVGTSGLISTVLTVGIEYFLRSH